MDLSNRVAVVTGASRGLGAGMARELHDQGLRLGLCSRSAPALPEGERVLARQLDVADAGALDSFAEEVATRFGRIDLWINNAGILEPIEPLRSIEPEEFGAHLDVNVLGVFLGTRAFIRQVRAQGDPGVLINISSGAGRKPYRGWAAYCAGKAAVDRLTEVVALEEKDAGLRAHAVAPGLIDTEMQELIRGTSADKFPEVERFRAFTDEDYADPADIARALLRLAFDPAAATDEVLLDLRD
jgi:NAD(P)-dependent dehydrogenase (short-subunit alcohol dehydrogenase family)